MKLKIKKTDGRYSGHAVFAYVVDVKSTHISVPSMNKILNLHTVREWCWTTWGPSCERDHYLEIIRLNILEANLNEHWCWHTEYRDCKIYLKNEKDLMWFKLKWSDSLL